jgi:hypothetical protein
MPQLRKATISFAMSVRLFASNNSASIGQIFMKFGSSMFFANLLTKLSFVKIGQE